MSPWLVLQELVNGLSVETRCLQAEERKRYMN